MDQTDQLLIGYMNNENQFRVSNNHDSSWAILGWM